MGSPLAADDDYQHAAPGLEHSNRAIPFSQQPDGSASDSASVAVQSEINSVGGDHTASQFSTGGASLQTSIGLDGSSTATLSSQDGLTGSIMSTTYNAYNPTTLPTVTGASSTFATSASGHGAVNSTSSDSGGPASASQDPSEATRPVSEHPHHGDGLSGGALAAAIILPILAALAIFALAFLWLRRRSGQNRERRRSGSSGGVPFFPAIKEKWGSLRSRSSNESGQASRNPVVMTEQNNAYFTGLDTSSRGGSSPQEEGGSGEYYPPGRRSEGGTTFIEAPPPYKSNSQSRGHSQTLEAPQLNEPSGLGAPFSLDMAHADALNPPQAVHSRDPVSPVSPLESGFLAASNPDDRPQSSSARSITSTLYSDTASVHSARAARMSVGPNIVQPPLQPSSRRGSDDDEGPFGDEANSPVTPLSVRDPERPK
ncbi:Hypothetical predicted protein [Lecanosticta acicola]|uniref:Uncharacterized protein n=1 Tax=Lecanosticta acicola TaxID=111012 RepID=A0AAI8Z8I3_9PEZI|nr:Hypothetical predicted protein [Lecanosticta acicola]